MVFVCVFVVDLHILQVVHVSVLVVVQIQQVLIQAATQLLTHHVQGLEQQQQ